MIHVISNRLYKICSFFSIFFIFVGFGLLIAYVSVTREVVECFHHATEIQKTIHCAALVPMPTFQIDSKESELIHKIYEHHLTNNTTASFDIAYDDKKKNIKDALENSWVAFQMNEITKEIEWFQGGPLLYQCLSQYKLHTNRGPFTVCFRTRKYVHILFYLAIGFISFAIPFFFFCTCNHQL